MNKWIKAIIIMTIFICTVSNYAADSDGDFYQDPKGLYSFVPPRGWLQKSFTDARSKVKFYDPSNPANSIRIIAGAVEKSSIAEFKSRKPRLERAFPGATVTVADDSVSGLPAVKFILDHKWYQHLYAFWSSGYEYSISLTAINKDKFQELATNFQTVLISFQVGQGKTPSDDDRKRAQCASWLRLIYLCQELKNLECAEYYEKLVKEAGCNVEQ